MEHLSWQQLNSNILSIAGWLGTFTISAFSPAWGQITPIGSTTTTINGLNIEVHGGTPSADGANLFHQFESLDVSTPETVTFVPPASVENVLGRVSGGQASFINGGLGVSGNANLWLINPAGILFGHNARLDLQGDFTAATAYAVGFGQGWFTDDTNYQALVGPPRSFAFLSEPAHLVNLGDLRVDVDQNLQLLGGQVINAGTLSAPAGTITVAAIANTNRINLSQTGQVLSLEIEPVTDNSLAPDITPLDIPTLLTGQGGEQADSLTLNADGTIQLGQATASMPEAGDAVVSGHLSTVGDQGGQIAVLGNRVAVVDATMRADGMTAGGQIYIGGNYQGNGPLPNADQTIVNQGTELSADALEQGNGGEIIIWADEVTHFSGSASAQGGNLSGDGGFIEISGKSSLAFTGELDVSASQGEFGTILFDPDNIEIVDGAGAANGDTELGNPVFGEVIAPDNNDSWFTIHENTLETWDGNANIKLQANNDIIVRNLGGDDTLSFQPGAGSIEFIADADNNGAGQFLIEQAGDLIDTAGRNIVISGSRIRFDSLDTRSNTGGAAGNASILGTRSIQIDGSLDASNISLTTDALAFNGGAASIRGTTFSISTADPTIDIYLGTPSAIDNPGALDISEHKILALKDGFTRLSFGRADSAGTIIVEETVLNGGSTPFQDPVNIVGANTLKMPDQPISWVITGDNEGNLNSLFSNGLSFENVNRISGGSSTGDVLEGSAGNDTIELSGTNAGTFNGITFGNIENIEANGGDDSFTVDINADISGIIDGGDGNNTIQGTNGNDVIILTDVGPSSINNVNFQGFDSVNAGDGNDRFFVNDGSWNQLDGGGGNDTLDYSGNSIGVTIDLLDRTTDDVAVFSGIENFEGSNAVDTLLATNGDDAIAITANNTGTFGTQTFSGIENIDTRDGNDTITFNDGTFITGALTGGNGTDTINYNNYTTDLIIDLQTRQATGIDGGYSAVESFVGGNGNDTFRLDDINPIQTINGGGGDNTLLGSNTDNIWNLTGVNTGNGSGVGNFNNIQNLKAGNQADQVNFLASGARFTGELDGAEGPLTLSGDSLGVGTDLRGQDELILQTASPDKNIVLGGAGGTPDDLDISTPELSNISQGFTAITIGRSDGTNTITLGDDVTFSAPVTIQAPNGDGSINAAGYNIEAPEITLSAAQDIFATNLTAANGVTLDSGASINTNNIITSNTASSGNVTITAGTTITTQQIDTSSNGGTGGNVVLNAPNTIQVDSIRAEGDLNGGTVDITTEEFFRATNSFTSLNGNTASISTEANNETGSITIRHSGNGVIPFEVGNGSFLGTNGTITSGTFQIDANSSFLNSYTLGNIVLLTRDLLNSPILPAPVNALSSLGRGTLPSPPIIRENLSSLDEAESALGAEDYNSKLFERLETSYSEQFKSHLNLYERVSVSPTSLESAKTTLGNVEQVLGVKPGVLYVYFLPSENKHTALPDPDAVNPDDELGLLLLTHEGQAIRKKIEGVTRADVMAAAENFSSHITNSISTTSQYLPPAQQLYNWFITPLEEELQEQKIQSLAMVMDTGLRTLPVAALHDGDKFLIERYSLGVIPSFSLTDFNPENFLYTQLDDTRLLAMGASQFPSQQQLPAVPDELDMVTATFPNSEVFLNDGFTLDNLKSEVLNNNFGIVHLASHGVFESGAPRNSYIQLWDQHLQLDQVNTLGLDKADIALMVLSACNTAIGDREAEYGFAGLAVNAGVQTSVASLWPISDEGTLGLMTYFYHHLQEQPVRATALRQAQLAMAQGDLHFSDGTLYGLEGQALAHFPELEYHGRWNFEHPFYWSTYTLVGSPW